jgi:hypothetical protein
MALPRNINTLEQKKFVADASGLVSARQQKASRRFNKLDFAVTELNSTEIKRITVPEGATDCILYHVDTGETAWLGNDQSAMTAGAATNAVPIPPNFQIPLEFIQGQEVELFGTVTAGTIKVYVIGMYKE